MNKTEEFIKKAKNIHGNKYNYDLVKYVRAIDKVIITCDKHGEFLQTPHSHLANHGCPKCAVENTSNLQRCTLEQFISKSKTVHGDLYDYSLVEYVNNSTKVKIICDEHGIFEQTPNVHFGNKAGCPTCGISKNSQNKFLKYKENFLERANKKHNNVYTYLNLPEQGSTSMIFIACSMHGVFEQVAAHHLSGVGCQKCGVIKSGISSRVGKDYILKKFKEKHGDTYHYNLSNNIKTSDKIEIECPKHGIFKQSVSSHYKRGCPKCGYERGGNLNRKIPKELDKVKRNVKRRLKGFMQSKGHKKQDFTLNILGCNWEELKIHLENNPYGFKIDCIDLDTDHIVPLSSARTESDLYTLNHYTNLQLLPKTYNQHIKKHLPFDREDFEKWLKETEYNKC